MDGSRVHQLYLRRPHKPSTAFQINQAAKVLKQKEPHLSLSALRCRALPKQEGTSDCGFFLNLLKGMEKINMCYILCGEAQVSNILSYPLSSSSPKGE